MISPFFPVLRCLVPEAVRPLALGFLSLLAPTIGTTGGGGIGGGGGGGGA